MTQRERQILKWIEENPLISQQELADKAGIARSSVAVHISNLMKQGHIAGKGYIVRTAPYVVVVGGVNMDIGGRPHGELVAADSNPGQVRMSLGGVGRNIAHNMALMGLDVRMLTAFGDDMNAQRIAASCGELGIDISQCLTVPGGATSTYLFITDGHGDMALAVSDMEIYEHVTPAFLAGRARLLQNAQLLVVDTNIPAQSIAWLAENIRLPIFADPVSTAKAEKLRPVLGKLHTLKPNRLEAELLSGVSITDAASLNAAADALLATGLRRVFISLGGDGVFAADHSGRVHVPCCPGEMVNTTGCGDAGMAAIAWAYLEGTGLEDTARAAMAAGASAMESAETINPDMSTRLLRRRRASGREWRRLDLLDRANPGAHRLPARLHRRPDRQPPEDHRPSACVLRALGRPVRAAGGVDGGAHQPAGPGPGRGVRLQRPALGPQPPLAGPLSGLLWGGPPPHLGRPLLPSAGRGHDAHHRRPLDAEHAPDPAAVSPQLSSGVRLQPDRRLLYRRRHRGGRLLLLRAGRVAL